MHGFAQWADYPVVMPALAGLEALDEHVDPREHFGTLGMNARTALVGVPEIAAIRPGE